MKLAQAFEMILESRQVKLEKQELQNSNVAYVGTYTDLLSEEFNFSVIFEDTQDRTDYLITYSGIGQLQELDLELSEVLFLINQLNQEKIAYYTLCLSPDGELYVRLEGRVTPNESFTIYEMLVLGSKMASEVRRTILELKDENDI